MANTKFDGKYLRCDIAFVRDAGVGGRLYSAEINEEVPNGVIGVMGATKADKPEVKAFTLGVQAGEDMYIVMKPEINYDERYKTDGALGNFRNEANKPFPIIRLQKRDRIVLSEDFIKLEASQITVGKKLAVDTDGLLKAETSGASGASGDGKFIVTEIKDSHVANHLMYDEKGAFLAPKAYKLITLEVIA